MVAKAGPYIRMRLGALGAAVEFPGELPGCTRQTIDEQ